MNTPMMVETVATPPVFLSISTSVSSPPKKRRKIIPSLARNSKVSFECSARYSGLIMPK